LKSSFAELLNHKFADAWRKEWSDQTGIDTSKLTDEQVMKILEDMSDPERDEE